MLLQPRFHVTPLDDFPWFCRLCVSLARIMSVIRPFEALDLLKFNQVNADVWTATYHTGYYANYLARWPDMCIAVESGALPGPEAPAESSKQASLKAYLFGKHEPPAPDPQHHGHLTALSISPQFRELGLARELMSHLEELSGPGYVVAGSDDRIDGVDAWFLDLFVRCNNKRAESMYEKLGYSIYRRVVDYYTGMDGVGSSRDELDGWDMRKSLAKDTTNRHIRSNGRDILVSPDAVWQ